MVINEYWDSISSGDGVVSYDLLTNAQSLREADSIVLWIGLGAAEQLLLAWMVKLLKYTRELGPRAVRVVGETMGVNFGADSTGDLYLFSRMLQLSNPDLPHPLLRWSGDWENVRSWQVALTDAGEAVLAGEANAVELNGIDDWVLGGSSRFRARSRVVSPRGAVGSSVRGCAGL